MSAAEPTQPETALDRVEVPLAVDIETAVNIREDLRDGETVVMEFDADMIPWMADCIDWQLEHDTHATRFVEGFDA